jgi:carbon storage regulator CsrA
MFGTATFFTNPRRVTMLVLRRKIGERLVIGTGIVITVASVCGKQVCLGVETPGDVPILRAELSYQDAETSSSLKGGTEPSGAVRRSEQAQERREREAESLSFRVSNV